MNSPGMRAPPCGSQLADTNVLVRSSFRVSGLLVVMKSIPPCDAGHHVLHRVDRPYVRDHAVGMCLLDPSRIARISREAVVDTPDAVLPDCGGSQVAVQVLHHGTREGVDDAFAGRIVESDVFHTVGQPLCFYGLDDGIRRTGVADEELSIAEPSLRNTTSSRIGRRKERLAAAVHGRGVRRFRPVGIEAADRLDLGPVGGVAFQVGQLLRRCRGRDAGLVGILAFGG